MKGDMICRCSFDLFVIYPYLIYPYVIYPYVICPYVICPCLLCKQGLYLINNMTPVIMVYNILFVFNIYPVCKANRGRKVWAGRCGQEGVGRKVWAGRCGQEGVGRKVWARRCGQEGVGRKVWAGRIERTEIVLAGFYNPLCLWSSALS